MMKVCFLVALGFFWVTGVTSAVFQVPNKSTIVKAVSGKDGKYKFSQCDFNACGTSYKAFRGCLAGLPKITEASKACYRNGLNQLVPAYMLFEQRAKTGKTIKSLKKTLPTDSLLLTNDFLKMLAKESKEEQALLLIRAVYYVGYEKGAILNVQEMKGKLDLLSKLRSKKLSAKLAQKISDIAAADVSDYKDDMGESIFSQFMNHTTTQLMDILKDATTIIVGSEHKSFLRRHFKAALMLAVMAGAGGMDMGKMLQI